MEDQKRPDNNKAKRFAWMTAIFLSFIVAFEIAIMEGNWGSIFLLLFEVAFHSSRSLVTPL